MDINNYDNIDNLVNVISKAIYKRVSEGTLEMAAETPAPSVAPVSPAQSFSAYPAAHAAVPGAALASRIDHTLLKADATEEQVIALCQEARSFGFSSVCVNTAYAPLAAGHLAGSGVTLSCVVGYPLGATSTESKIAEAQEAVRCGAASVEMVAHIGMIKSRNWNYVKTDIERVKQAVNGRAVLKVIIETALLSEEEKIKAGTISKLIGVDIVKTSTGFSSRGATTADVRLLREAVGSDVRIEASGGIRTAAEAEALLQAGADLIGTGNSISIVTGDVRAVDSGGHVCVGCGTCRQVGECPTGKVDVIVANNY